MYFSFTNELFPLIPETMTNGYTLYWDVLYRYTVIIKKKVTMAILKWLFFVIGNYFSHGDHFIVIGVLYNDFLTVVHDLLL